MLHTARPEVTVPPSVSPGENASEFNLMALPREAPEARENRHLAQSLGRKGTIERQELFGTFPKPSDHQKETAAPAGPRNGGRNAQEAVGKLHHATCRTGRLLARFVPVWSDDRRHLQGWEAAR